MIRSLIAATCLTLALPAAHADQKLSGPELRAVVQATNQRRGPEEWGNNPIYRIHAKTTTTNLVGKAVKEPAKVSAKLGLPATSEISQVAARFTTPIYVTQGSTTTANGHEIKEEVSGIMVRNRLANGKLGDPYFISESLDVRRVSDHGNSK